MSKVSPRLINELKDNEIFVFGSNESGIHGGGAAKTALRFGAKNGESFGLQGKTFAIPTVNASVRGKLPIEKVKRYVEEFLKFAKENKDKIFLVTEIGCGIAGFRISDIAPMFKSVVENEAEYENIYLPESFIKFIESNSEIHE